MEEEKLQPSNEKLDERKLFVKSLKSTVGK